MIKRFSSLILVFFIVLSFILPCYATEDANVYRCHENSSMKIALTFDDGPHPRYTPMILDILKQYDIHATFFLIGENVALYPDLAKRILDEGHEIGNHTFTHRNIGKYGLGELNAELEHCEQVIYELASYKPTLFRPPQGRLNHDVTLAAETFGYKVILWNIDTRDWMHESPEAIKKNVIQNVEAGSIILMYDFVSHNSPTPKALELFLPRLIEEGYTFSVVSDLIGSE